MVDRAMAQARNRLGRLIRERREALGISQKELADRAGLTQQMISKIERGKALPLPRLESISQVIGLDRHALTTRFLAELSHPFASDLSLTHTTKRRSR